MSDPVIRVAGLSKRYLLLHQQPERYTALRDVIARRFRSLGRGVLAHGGALGGGASPPAPAREDFWALRDVSFEVRQGERVGIIGRNGAGKSTLLKILSRITEPTTGRIELQGRVASLLEVGTGFHPELTGRENIFLNGAILGMGRAEIRRKFDEIVAFAEVEKFLDTPVKRYSSGMYVRLAFAVAAHLETEILIVDEVLAVGDVQFQRKCVGKMSELDRDNKTLLFVSHNLGLVHHLCDRCLLLEGGEVRAQGATAKVIDVYLSLDASPGHPKREAGAFFFSDDEFDLLDFETRDSHSVRRETFKTNESVHLFLRYRIKRQCAGLRIGFDVISLSDGGVLFRSFDDDRDDIDRGAGLCEAEAVIPGDLLLQGAYLLQLQVGIHNVRWLSHDSLGVRIAVESIDGLNSRYGDQRPGRILPSTQWRVMRRSA
jgi:lipopolysaccharide transport system ATP-binding protein